MAIDHQPDWVVALRRARSRRVQPLLWLVLLAGYLACAWTGNLLSDPVTHVVPVYPAAGFAVAALLRFGWRRLWLWTIFAMMAGTFPEVAVTRYLPICLAVASAMILSAALTERFADGAAFVRRPERVFRFVFACVAAFAVFSAGGGVGFLVWVGDVPGSQFVRQAIWWGVADIVGVLLVTPLLLTWSEEAVFPRLPLFRWVEAIFLLLLSVVMTQLAFAGWPFRHFYPLIYLPIPVLLWAAFRFPLRGPSTLMLVVAALAFVNTMSGNGSFAAHRSDALTLLQAYLGCVSLLVLVISAGVRQLHAQTLELQHSFAEAERARGLAERADRAKSAFLSRMSHELRTPLNAILGFGQILHVQHGQDEMIGECSQHILDAGRHLLGMVNEVLDLATVERGKMVLKHEPVDAGSLARECLGALAAKAREYGVTCRVEEPRPWPAAAPATTDPGSFTGEAGAVGDGEPEIVAGGCVIVADRARLHRVMMHLLSNAVLYNKEGGEVTVSFARAEQPVELANSGKRWRIRVTDTGPGFSAEQQEQLFTPFQRLGAERSDREGTGLGLTVARSLVQAMGGRFGLETTPGQGSTFWLELPAA